MNTFAHLSIDVLTDLAHETSPVNAQAQAHLGDCQQCANTLAQLRHVIGVMRSDRTEEVPSHVIQRAERLLRQRRPIPTPERQPSLPQRILAVLRFDSFQQPAFGLRSGKPIARQLLFSAGDSDIDLRIAPSNGDWQITGQVLGPTAGGQATLIGSQIEGEFGPLVTLRVAVGSGTAFLVAQLTDVTVFHWYRRRSWWRAPFISTLIGSSLDTILFFTIAFSAQLTFFGPQETAAAAWASEVIPFLGFGKPVPLWISLAVADWCVKIGLAVFAGWFLSRAL